MHGSLKHRLVSAMHKYNPSQSASTRIIDSLSLSVKEFVWLPYMYPYVFSLLAENIP